MSESQMAPQEIQQEVDRALELLRALIKRQGWTQLEVQDRLGWGRTYISQLLRRQKSLRYDQILQILDVLGVHPVDFFGMLYDTRWVTDRESFFLDYNLQISGKARLNAFSLGLMARSQHLMAALGLLVELLEDQGDLPEGVWAKALQEMENAPERVAALAARVSPPARRPGAPSSGGKRQRQSDLVGQYQEAMSILAVLLQTLETKGLVSKKEIRRKLAAEELIPVRNETLAWLFGVNLEDTATVEAAPSGGTPTNTTE